MHEQCPISSYATKHDRCTWPHWWNAATMEHGFAPFLAVFRHKSTNHLMEDWPKALWLNLYPFSNSISNSILNWFENHNFHLQTLRKVCSFQHSTVISNARQNLCFQNLKSLDNHVVENDNWKAHPWLVTMELQNGWHVIVGTFHESFSTWSISSRFQCNHCGTKASILRT